MLDPTVTFCWHGVPSASPDGAYSPLSGVGAQQHGGRFNRPGIPALYTSLDFTTAWLEAQQGFPFKPQPLTLVAYQVDCSDIVDLTQPEILQQLGISAVDLACAWEWLAYQQQLPPTWALGERLQAEAVAGIIVPSYAPGCGMVIVMWCFGSGAAHRHMPFRSLTILVVCRTAPRPGNLRLLQGKAPLFAKRGYRQIN